MRSIAKWWLWVFLLAVLPVAAHAQDETNDLVQEIYVRSGMEKQMEQIPLLIQTGVDQAVAEDERIRNLPGDFPATMKALAREAFAPGLLRETMLAEMRAKLTIRELNEVIKWLDSPLGDKCSRLEEAATSPDAMVKMEQYAAGLQKSPPTAERLNALRQLDSATKATENGVEIAIETQIAVFLAMVSAFPKEQQIPREKIAREIGKARPKIEASIREQTLLSLLYTYQSLTKAEIHEYAAFAASPAGEKYHAVSIAAFKKALFIGSTNWGEALGKALQKYNERSKA